MNFSSHSCFRFLLLTNTCVEDMADFLKEINVFQEL